MYNTCNVVKFNMFMLNIPNWDYIFSTVDYKTNTTNQGSLNLHVQTCLYALLTLAVTTQFSSWTNVDVSLTHPETN